MSLIYFEMLASNWYLRADNVIHILKEWKIFYQYDHNISVQLISDKNLPGVNTDDVNTICVNWIVTIEENIAQALWEKHIHLASSDINDHQADTSTREPSVNQKIKEQF